MKHSNMEWFNAMTNKGHTPLLYEGEIDMLAYDSGWHNGPMCATCRWGCCEFCNEDMEIPQCQ